MKRFISVLLCIFLIMSLISASGLAASSSSTEKVLLAIRPRIPDTSVYEEFSSSVTSENGKTVYNFNWSSTKDGNYKGMYVSALESGIITGFGVNNGKSDNAENTPSGFDRIPIKEALARTKELIDKLNPSISSNLTLTADDSVEQFDAKNHTFTITHTESGIPVYGDRGRVTTDINAENITSFTLSYTEKLTYPSAINIIDLSTAKKAFAEKIGLDLYYKIRQDTKKNTVEIYPVYSPKADDIYINAQTGEAEKIIPVSDSYLIKNESMSDSAAGSGANTDLTPAELKELQNLKKLLSRTDAENHLRSIKPLGISKDYTLEEFTTRKLSATEELYGHALVFCSKNEERGNYIFVDINAESGEVLSFSNFAPNTSEVSKPEEITAFQSEVFETLAPDKYTEYTLRNTQNRNNYFVYDRYVNGIRVEGNTVSIEVNPDKTLASYRISYTNAEFPTTSRFVSNDIVCKNLFDSAAYSLVYIPQKSSDELKQPDFAALIYTLDDLNIYFDAYIGNRINADGTEYVTSNIRNEYTDISGHYAEAQIKALRRFGIGFDRTDFLPDKPCLQKDFIILLAGAFGGHPQLMISRDTKADDYYTTAKRLGIIKEDEVSPDSSVSRIQAAKFICRALKIEKYAQLENIFNCPFADVTSDKGYVTMLWGMGIVNGTGKNTFSPDTELTRGQTAILIYNAMNNR